MANRPRRRGNQPHHHSAWDIATGHLGSWQRVLGTLAVILLVVAMFAPGIAEHLLGNAAGAVASALQPFVGVLAFAVVVYIGLRMMFRRGH